MLNRPFTVSRTYTMESQNFKFFNINDAIGFYKRSIDSYCKKVHLYYQDTLLLESSNIGQWTKFIVVKLGYSSKILTNIVEQNGTKTTNYR